MIKIECACGKTGSVKDEYAGRKIRCPACKGPIRVPGGEEADPGDRGAARRPPAPQDDIPDAAPDPDGEAPGEEGDAGGGGAGEKACPFCGEAIKAVAKKCRHCGEFLDKRLRRDARGATQRDVDHERHVRAIGLWFRLGGLLLFLAAGLAGLGALTSGGRGTGPVLAGATVMSLVGALYFGVGQGLWTYHAWARWTALVLVVLGALSNVPGLAIRPSLAGLVGVLIGLAWTGALAWALLAARATRIFTGEYRALVERTRSTPVPFWTSVFFIVPAVLLGLGLALLALAVLGVMGRL